MEFMNRIKKIVVQTNNSIDSNNSSEFIENYSITKYKPQNGLKSGFSEDPQVIRTLIDNIPHRFYNSNCDKVVEEEISEFCSEHEIPKAQTRVSKLAAHNKAVCRRIYQLVLEKQSQYQHELNGVLELQKENMEALTLCRTVRNNMDLAMQGLVQNRLNVLVNFRRTSRLKRVIESLTRIKTLQMSVESLLILLNKEDFYNAIQLYTQCQAVVDDFIFYVCIDKMRKRLKTIRVNIEESLDSALMRTCEKFDSHQYEQLQKSFCLLGSGASSIDQLQMHYASIIQNRSMKIVMKYTEKHQTNSIVDSSEYADFCKMLLPDRFLDCLQELCCTLFEVLRCYQSTINWHKSAIAKDLLHQNEKITSLHEMQQQNTNLPPQQQSSWSENYQLERLLTNKPRIWLEISARVKLMIEQCPLNSTKLELDDVMKLLNIINKMTTVGSQFCDSQSLDLQDSVRIKFQDFFKSFHLKHLERLKMFLENELWEICPVKKTFSFMDLAEFASFRRKHKSSSSDEVNLSTQECHEIFRTTSDNPFYNVLDVKMTSYDQENIMGDDISMEYHSKRLSISIDDDSSVMAVNFGPIIANTTLEVCRLIGRYMEIMRLLKPIAMDIVNSLCQLYDYYMFSVYYIFCESLLERAVDLEIPVPRKDKDSRLSVVLRRIWDRLILHRDPEFNNNSNTESKVELPSLNFPAAIPDLSQAIVAVESLIYLGQGLLRDSLLPQISDRLPEAKRGLLRIFTEQNLNAGQQLRLPIYDCCIGLIYTATDTQACAPINTTNWNLKNVAVNHSDYLTDIQSNIREFQTRLKQLSIRLPLTRDLIKQLWVARVKSINRQLLKCYSGIVNCSQAGRHLLLIDWQLYVKSVNISSGFTDLFEPQHLIERYIKAYNYSSGEFEQFIKDNYQSYQRGQLNNLIVLVSKHDKRLRQKWTAFHNDLLNSPANNTTALTNPSLNSNANIIATSNSTAPTSYSSTNTASNNSNNNNHN